MSISNGSRPTGNRASAFLVDYDKSAGAAVRAKAPKRTTKPVIDFYVATPHRSQLVLAAGSEPRSLLRRAVRRVLRRG